MMLQNIPEQIMLCSFNIKQQLLKACLYGQTESTLFSFKYILIQAVAVLLQKKSTKLYTKQITWHHLRISTEKYFLH